MGPSHTLDRAGKRLVNAGGLLLRYALWSATAEIGLRANGPIALGYHNITPGDLLRDFNPGLADLCDRGRAALPRFRGTDRHADRRLELQRRGASRRRARRGDRRPAAPRAAAPRCHAASPNREPVVVTVGRIVPNKRLDDVDQVVRALPAPSRARGIAGHRRVRRGFESYRTCARGAHRRGSASAARVLHRRDLLRGARRVVSPGGRLPVDVGARGLLRAADRGPCATACRSWRAAPGPCPRRSAAQASCSTGPTYPLVAEALHELASSQPTRNALYDAADRRLAELRPDVLAPRIRSALGALLTAS